MPQEFLSTKSLGEAVEFLPSFKQMDIPEHIVKGEIVAVRFTKAKVFYDILGDSADLFSNVDSSNLIYE